MADEAATVKTDNQAPTKKNSLWVPLSILVAGALIGGSIIYTQRGKTAVNSAGGSALGNQAIQPTPPTAGPSGGGQPNNVKAVTAADHILGKANATVKLIEFSDLECPFCKSFHPTMKKLMEEYGRSGQLAWIYRHFPLDNLHPKARKEAEATECAAEQGGNDKFWAYVDRLFEVTPSNNGLNPGELPQIATTVGLDKSKFESCLNSGKYAMRVADDLQDARNAGGQGTPYSVVIAKDGRQIPVNGAVPYEELKTVIEEASR